MSEADEFSKSSKSSTSKSPDRPPFSPYHTSHEESRKHFVRSTQPCLVFQRDRLEADFGSERDQESIEIYIKSLFKRCLAVGHLVLHVAQEATTFNGTVHREGHLETSLWLFLRSLGEQLFPRPRWFPNEEVYSRSSVHVRS